MVQNRVHQLFLVSVTLKGLHALIELVGGLALYLFDTRTIVGWLYRAAGESNDLIAKFARTFTGQEHHFYAFYLISHGIVNMVIVAALLSRKLWAYPATFVVLVLFIAYQLYRYSFTHDIGLIAVTLLDVVVIGLASNEYRLLRKHHPTH